ARGGGAVMGALAGRRHRAVAYGRGGDRVCVDGEGRGDGAIGRDVRRRPGAVAVVGGRAGVAGDGDHVMTHRGRDRDRRGVAVIDALTGRRHRTVAAGRGGDRVCVDGKGRGDGAIGRDVRRRPGAVAVVGGRAGVAGDGDHVMTHRGRDRDRRGVAV